MKENGRKKRSEIGMREIEIVLIDPRVCAERKGKILTIPTLIAEYARGRKIVLPLFSEYFELKSLSLRDLERYFEKDEIKAIMLFREYQRRLRENISTTEIEKELMKIEPSLLSQLARKAARLNLILDCLGNLKFEFFLRKELKKIDENLRKGDIARLEESIEMLDEKIESLESIFSGEKE